MGDRLIELSAPIRPTRYRLLTAMGISACLVAVLLAVLGAIVDSVESISILEIEQAERLTLIIRKGEAEPKSDLAAEDRFVHSSPQDTMAPAEHVDLSQDVVTAIVPNLSANAEPARDWHAIAEEAAKASVDEYIRNEEIRAARWRKTRTVMFQPASDFELEEDPIIRDFRFKPEVHVVGLGVTIGSCFFGIPLAGVPVEQRTVAMTFFVCADDSG